MSDVGLSDRGEADQYRLWGWQAFYTGCGCYPIGVTDGQKGYWREGWKAAEHAFMTALSAMQRENNEPQPANAMG
jgi:hypothetical protein